MSAPDGQDPPQVPHWMHMSRWQSPGVAIATSCRKVRGLPLDGDEWPVVAVAVAVVKGHLLSNVVVLDAGWIQCHLASTA